MHLCANVIERIFGVLKRRFCILLLAPEYDLNTQVRIPSALCTIHNFIWHHCFDDEDLADVCPFMDDWNDPDYHYVPDVLHVQAYVDEEGLEVGGNGEFKRMHDNITQEIWVDYQGILMERLAEGLVELDDFDLLEEELVDHELDVIF
ncbi:hypothetical protein BDN67DRAFT_898914 [Paxillus ammoniavirescens]|nr:hypothetical protein BDN67DRAFT_898914 [Paxillus ammoniavirescens]